MFYDGLLLFGVLFFATALVLLAARVVFDQDIPSENPLFQLYLVAVSYLYFAWFWIHGGQTLGMKAWRMRVQRVDGSRITWRDALVRFVAALISWMAAGLGHLWVLVDPERRAWHDRLSATVLVTVVKR